MGKLVKTIFGGVDRSAQKGQTAFNEDAQDFTRQMLGQARGDAFGLGPAREANQNMGFQSALDVYGQTIPQQLSTFQQGNMGAQSQLLAGMPQFHNAIMGLPVNYNAFQPTQISYDPSFAQQTLPQFIGSGEVLAGREAAPSAGQAAMLAGGGVPGWLKTPRQQV